MKVTNGSVQSDVVPLTVRYPMLQMWVLIKQMLQQQISKSLGIGADEEVKFSPHQSKLMSAMLRLELSFHDYVLKYSAGADC